jgi:hypothetical protein
MSTTYNVGDVYVMGGFYFVITAVNNNEDIRCHVLDDYDHGLDVERPIYLKDGQPVAYYPEGLFVSRRDYFSKVALDVLEELCFDSKYVCPFKEYQLTYKDLYDYDDEGVWIVANIKPEIMEKLLKQISVILEKDKDITNANGVKLIEGGEPVVEYIYDYLDLK